MARKKKIKADSLTGLWKRLDEVVPPFLSAKVKARGPYLEVLSSILDEVNTSPIPGAIAQSVICPYFSSEENSFSVTFRPSARDRFGKSLVWFEMDDKQVGVDPVGLYRFWSELGTAAERLAKANPEDEPFDHYRTLAFFREVAKLPRQYLIFIVVLKEIAQVAQIVAVEKRDGGYADSDSPTYLSLLWAFKEFENFYQRSQHRDLRADYGIIWHEGQWVEASPQR